MKKLLFLVAMVCLGFKMNAQVNLAQGLIAYYPLNGNAMDISGNNNSGIISGASLVTDRYGKSNSAYIFNGTDNFISISSLNGTNMPAGMDGFNVSAWYQANNLVQESQLVSLCIQAKIFIKDGYIKCNVKINTDWTQELSCQTNTDWNFVSFNYSKNNKIELYLNGVLKDSHSITNSSMYNECWQVSSSIGKYWYSLLPGYDAWFYNGKIDEVRIYNRPLNSDEITALYKTDMNGNIDYDYINFKNQVKKLQFSVDSIKNNCCKATKALTIPLDNNGALLYQNAPNPFNQNTVIKYFVPYESKQSFLYVYDLKGTQLKSYNLNKGDCNVTIYGNELIAGIYLYSLVVDGKMVDTKQMILTE